MERMVLAPPPLEIRRRADGKPAARRSWLRPGDATRRAGALALTYAAVGVVYIVVSGELVALMAGSVAEAAWLESVKGVAFVLATALALFLLCRAMFERLAAQHARIALQLASAENTDRALVAGMFATTVAHDINNAVTAAHAALLELESRVGADPAARGEVATLRRVLAEVAALNRRHFDLGARRHGGPPVAFDLGELVRASVELAQRHAHLRDCRIEQRVAAGAERFVGHEQALRRALLNLIVNAAEAGGAGCTIEVSLAVDHAGVLLAVDDDGPGVPATLRDSVLEPFFTTKQDGSGVGLTSVQACAAAHGGRLAIAASALGGARFELHLPRVG